MTIDIFAALVQPLSRIEIHNVQLLDVRPGEDGRERFVVEHQGTKHELTGGSWNETFSRRDVGRFGYVLPATARLSEHREGVCYFRPYLDQSLRRVPEFDASTAAEDQGGRAPEVVGWVCDSVPGGFRAPVGIVPGENGRFVPDETIPITVRVPPEFVRECKRVQMSPEELLRSFVGDLAGIQNFTSSPRADRYGSNGSDERDYAEQWLDRAHGMNAIDLDDLEAREQESKDKQFEREDFLAFLDDFQGQGGTADDLFRMVQEIVDRQTQSGASNDRE
ncbi:hypothetical protein KDX16_30960 [Burkholderia vietnamiensis]|uniref:hypothetical protein n=2 Tax=Burkholderia vietnamiensis TaxID=60552 RepID=UPI001B978948|nr:hypothetical protein [Burkholderia vietnamiensis]MBR7920221.1 hypothetical protein [Burkholderia vietnamiensis]HDR9133231.1 hypothetical protein [Burkholderia vietnamiensis]